MGKKLRQTNVSGLSHFLEAFVDASIPNSSAVAGPSCPEKSKPVDSEQQPPVKKRKTGLLGPGNEAYDATELVPFYTDAAQVPAHLQKCTHAHTQSFPASLKYLRRHRQILPSEHATSQGTKRDAFWTRRGGIA
jgi:hypothetical protein